MSEKDSNIASLSSAKTATSEERALRDEWSRRVASANSSSVDADTTPEEGELADLLNMADGLLYTTEFACKEYLSTIPPDLSAAVLHLRHAWESRDSRALKLSIARLERVSNEIFDPGGPGGPKASMAALGVVDSSRE